MVGLLFGNEIGDAKVLGACEEKRETERVREILDE
jgi:hypothetical protein